MSKIALGTIKKIVGSIDEVRILTIRNSLPEWVTVSTRKERQENGLFDSDLTEELNIIESYKKGGFYA